MTVAVDHLAVGCRHLPCHQPSRSLLHRHCCCPCRPLATISHMGDPCHYLRQLPDAVASANPTPRRFPGSIVAARPQPDPSCVGALDLLVGAPDLTTAVSDLALGFTATSSLGESWEGEQPPCDHGPRPSASPPPCMHPMPPW